MDYFKIFFFGFVFLAASFSLWKGRSDGSMWFGYLTIFAFLYLSFITPMMNTVDPLFDSAVGLAQANPIPMAMLVITVLLLMMWKSGVLLEGFRRTKDLSQPRKPRGYTAFAASGGGNSSALMGTCTTNFDDHQLSVRDIALMRLAIYMGGGLSQKFNVALSQKLALPLSHRASYQNELSRSLTAHTDRLSTIARPLMREAWGNYDIPQRVLSDLCDIAKQCGHRDHETISRLNQIAKQLKLPGDLVGKLMH